MFYVQDPSLLEFQRRFQRQLHANNLSTTFGVSQIPADSQFRALLDRHDYQPILACFADWIGRMQRAKWLQQYQLFDARYLITLDGSQYFSSEQVHCEHCLSTTNRHGTVRYHHDILQAAIVHPDKRQVLPLALEFVRNSDANGGIYDKQDCEINAGYRMLQRLRTDYPRMDAVIVADSLYSKQPFVEQLRAARARSCWSPSPVTTSVCICMKMSLSCAVPSCWTASVPPTTVEHVARHAKIPGRLQTRQCRWYQVRPTGLPKTCASSKGWRVQRGIDPPG